MAKPKVMRSLTPAAESQHSTETSHGDRFEAVKELATGTGRNKPASNAGRVSPQLSCTIAPEDKALLNELTLFASNKAGKIVNTSTVIRALIRQGDKRRDELEF